MKLSDFLGRKSLWVILGVILCGYFYIDAGKFDAGINKNTTIPRLWKIQKAGLPDSFVFGTMHINDRRADKLFALIKPSLDQSASVFTEHNFFSAENDKLSQFVIAGPGNLSESLSAEKYKQVLSVLNKRHFPPEYLAKLDSVRAIILLYLYFPDTWFTKNIDTLIAEYAVVKNKKYDGLELMDDKLEPFKKIPSVNTANIIDFMLKNEPQREDGNIKMANMYFENTLPETADVIPNLTPDMAVIAEKFKAGFVDERNIKMLKNMELALNKGERCFFAAGMAHLPGKNGLLEMLKSHGYKLVPVL